MPLDPDSTELLITALMLIERANPNDDEIWLAHGMMQAILPGTSMEDKKNQIVKAAEINAALVIQRIKS